MKNMTGFVIRYDSTQNEDGNYEVNSNYRYYSNSEGSSDSPIYVKDLNELLNMLLNEIDEREKLLEKVRRSCLH